MGIFEFYMARVKRYYEPNMNTLSVFKRDYFNLPILTSLYLNVHPKYLALSVIQLACLVYHAILILNSSVSLLNINFTLASFEFQIVLIILFPIIIIFTFNVNRTELNILHSEMVHKIFEYEEADSEYIGQLYREVGKENKKLLMVPILGGLNGGFVLIICPFLDSGYGTFAYNGTELSSKSWDLPVPLVEYPISLDNNPLLFYLAIFGEGMAAYFVVSTLAAAGYLFINLSQVTCLNLKYLAYNVERLERRAVTMREKELGKWNLGMRGTKQQLYKDADFIRCYKRCLRKSIQHHQLIIRWKNYFQSFGSFSLGVAYFTGTLVIAFSLLSIKTGTNLPGTFLSSITFCVAEVGFIGLLSMLGQRITDLSEELRLSLYNTKWYYAPKSLNLDLLIFQEGMQDPIKLTAFGITPANNDTFSNVMNSAYSYYNVLMAF
uniref:Odorant receptor n=1 Tax=Yemma signatus TaxID=300820 RepID=A0A385H609_9HEMI|nr:odorant receptor [Yemma signatus]